MSKLEEVVILITDDDPGHVRLIEKNLQRYGLRNPIECFNNGQEILDFLFCKGKRRRVKETHYLLLLDIRMPKMDGIETLQRIKADPELKKMPVIMLTTTDDLREIDLCHMLGCNKCILKPVDYDKFSEVIKQLDLLICAHTSAGSPSSNSQNINVSLLIVDDDPGILQLSQKALERENFDVSTSSSGKSAVEWLGKHHADLVLLDLKLADIEAGEVIARLKELGQSPFFIIITGQGDERIAVEMMQRGAMDYLVKDCDFLELLPARVLRAFEQIEKERRLECLEQEVLQISESEQQRIGRDLHDSVCQRLIGIELMIQTLEQKVACKSKTLAAQLAGIARHVREVAAQTRSLAHGLSPLVLGTGGLMETFQELAENTEKLFTLSCRFQSNTPVSISDYNVATHLYRIAQEAVTNAIKHGKATSIEIRLEDRPEEIVLAITDDGCGLGQLAPDKYGMGLHIMQYRANQISAALRIESRPTGGVAVICLLPKDTNSHRRLQ